MDVYDELLDLTLCPIMLKSLPALEHYLVSNIVYYRNEAWIVLHPWKGDPTLIDKIVLYGS